MKLFSTSLLKVLIVSLLIFKVSYASAQHTVTKLWQTDEVLAIPESVLVHNGILYVSLIDGEAWAKDGKGGIAQVATNGKIINTDWITGLHAPKGMAVKGNLLYIADLDELVVVNIKQSKVESKIAIAGSKGLNDVTIDKKGIVYVTDSMNGTVYKIEGGKAEQYLDGLKGINGIKWVADKLYILTSDGIYVAANDKKITKIAVLEHGGDGIEPVGNGDFLVTAWGGYLYYVKADGTKELLLDTHTTNYQTADIGYDAKNRIIYVPTFFGKSVVAYKLN